MSSNAKLAGRYEVIGELGRGGMGIVHRARDPLLNREVAVKVVASTDLTPEAEERFQREAQIVAQMDHPGIVPIYDLGHQDGSLFFVMPLVLGTSLRNLLWERSSTWRSRSPRHSSTAIPAVSFTATSNPKTSWSSAKKEEVSVCGSWTS